MSKPYRFLIIDTYYPHFLSSVYLTNPHAARYSYLDQRGFLMNQRFGVGDSYSQNLIKLGCEAEEIIANNKILQSQWANENGIRVEELPIISLSRKIPLIKKLIKMQRNSLLNILEKQIKKAKPDILYMQDLSFCPTYFLRSIKRYVRLLIGQIASPLPEKSIFEPYDLIVSSLPHYVNMFRSMGIKSEYFKLGFENSILDAIVPGEPKYDVVHVGGYGPIHQERNELLEAVLREAPIQCWGYGKDNLSSQSNIMRNYNGESWGVDRYRIFSQSKIVITKHISSVAGEYCNNMTLYEGTGCGALLLTDYKNNLHDLFATEEEVIAYKSPEEAIQKIKYYLAHEAERKSIADAGQKRTLSEHSYYNRMKNLLDIVDAHVGV